MRLGISNFKVGKRTFKFKTPLLLNQITGPAVAGGICVTHDGLQLTACGKTLLECDKIIREELAALWVTYVMAPGNELSAYGLPLRNKLLAMVDNTPKKLEIGKVRYPNLNPIMALYPNPEILLGHKIFWEEKRDGSNVGVYLSERDILTLRSRNMDKASESFHNIFLETDEAENVKEMLISMRDDWNDECVVFGELLVKGKSPTRTELHEKHEFVVFDIWSTKVDGFIPYMLIYQYCYHFDLPIVELYGWSQHVTLESLLEFRDEMLEIAKKNGREGIVGKSFGESKKYMYFKEKNDLPKLDRVPHHIEDGKPVLPSLSESEILGALDKALVDLGMPGFKDVRKALPLFADYIKVECRKHNCSRPDGNLFNYYKAKLEEGK